MPDPYLEAALNKIGIAVRYLAKLDKLRDGDESEREEIQLNYEGVLTSGSSAGDQLAEAISQRLSMRLRNPSPERLLESLGEQGRCAGELAPSIELLRAWTSEAIVVDAHHRRNRAVHHHYKKRPYRPELTWLLDPIQIRGKPSPYQGPLDVHDYCANYVTALAKLEEAVRLIEGAG